MKIRKEILLKLASACLTAGIVIIGFTAQISAQKVRLRAQITPNCTQVRSTAGWKFSDIFADGNIAVQGSYGCNGAFIYNISNPDAPTLSAWYNPGNNQQFLEAIVVGNRGYFGSGNGGGVHIVDLTNPTSPQLLGIVNSTSGNGHNSIHEMMIYNQNGQTFLIENFNSTTNKIIKIINITNPASPVFIRDFNPTEAVWVHAMHIRGNRMFTSGWGNSNNRGRTEIYDISNLATQAPTLLGFISDTSTSITAGNNMHSSWTSEDGNFLYSCRETADGQGDVRTYDITNPAQPLLVNRVTMNDLALNAVTPHNPVVFGNKLYVAWYQAGLQVFDISIQNAPKRVAQYDTFQPQFTATEDSLLNEPWDMVCGMSNFQNALPTNYNGNWAVFPLLGEDKVLAGDMTNGLLILDARNATAPSKNVVSDFDGDRKTDFSVFTPSNGNWSVEKSSDNSFSSTTFGTSEDKIVAGDYDGDGKSDVAVFRASAGAWYILGSTNNAFTAVNWGASSDIPVAADYDADGKTDVAVFRPSNGAWYILQSTLGFKAVNWGANGDKPLVGDFEGDGKPDQAVYRNGVWYILQSSSTIPTFVSFGTATDKPLVGDFDGDGKTDITVYRPSEGYWYILNSNNNSLSVSGFGLSDDVPVPADYDGDGKTDISVFRPSANAWYRLNSSNGAFVSKTFGQTGDKPSPASAQP
ncbi:MAG TPA: FG-GAP-like repeat-containing protein [Pyrinomonadaceae bacterium]|nr:FG-GAP-like repeat-containing protein [Pyrinomonadaceae bacterium]